MTDISRENYLLDSHVSRVFKLYKKGYPNYRIAYILELSEDEVKDLLKVAFDKIDG